MRDWAQTDQSDERYGIDVTEHCGMEDDLTLGVLFHGVNSALQLFDLSVVILILLLELNEVLIGFCRAVLQLLYL